jgi:hypothetical protein
LYQITGVEVGVKKIDPEGTPAQLEKQKCRARPDMHDGYYFYAAVEYPLT